MSSPVRFGIDRLIAEDFSRLKGKRVGLIANQTTLDSQLRHLADLLHQAPDVTLAALFGPEHGVRGDAQDMIGVASDLDPKTGVTVHSLYGSDVASLSPSLEQIKELDLLIFDVQDVGSRYYTFAATMAYAMKAAADAGVAFLVLDRPNPLGGDLVEGPTVEPGYESFVGFHPMPIRHGLTVAEIAQLVRAELGLSLELDVIPCEGWRRSMTWSELNAPWINPSPNMPSETTALVYPGGCLVEGTNLSEGRGTTRPFEYWGAPWLEADELIARASELLGDLAEGCRLRPNLFRPTFHKFAGETCAGAHPIVTDVSRFRPVAVYTALLAAAFDQDSSRFAWRTETYEFVSDPIAIELLFGSRREHLLIENGLTPAVFQELVLESWRGDERAFRERRAPFLLYPEAEW